MGREARCAATWGARHGDVSAHLESAELSVRGAFRARAPLAVRALLRERGLVDLKVASVSGTLTR